MIKEFAQRSRQKAAGAAAGSEVRSPVWTAVGRRLQRRRIELGYGVDRVAQWAAIPAETYRGYENGVPIPAALLAQIADLFEMSLVRLFQDVGQDDADDADEDDGDEQGGPVVYRVATIEHRIAALVESFRQLDFEGQQHLLAISKALCGPGARAAQD
jgi:transcriptional regulator with XRE-family HTH domain